MSALTEEWLDVARDVAAPIAKSDRFICAETDDPRMPHLRRRVVVGGIVDGRAHKPGVILLSLTSDDLTQQFGVSTREQAAAVIDALASAWPDLRPAKADVVAFAKQALAGGAS